MPWSSTHAQWLSFTDECLTIHTGELVPVFEFAYDITDEEIMTQWAKHFRNHYCRDKEIEYLKPPSMVNSEYLLTLKFPNRTSSPGPSIRSGDFAEILVADFLEYLCKYYVPRTRYDRKTIQNESTKGSDVIGFKSTGSDPTTRDELIIYEVKARLTENNAAATLQTAVDDSKKDETRLAESLNGIKQRLFDRKDFNGVEVISRFQLNVEHPYVTKFGAAAVVTESSYCEATLSSTSSEEHPNKAQLEMLVIKGPKLMELVHQLYERAANEA